MSKAQEEGQSLRIDNHRKETKKLKVNEFYFQPYLWVIAAWLIRTINH
ncbi:hypothetical protein [Vibrio gallaecicus]|nr:hypothetical protein [Vibrio gallaecicus]MDN3615401.1 hypothetical protein [Vibrio gallaecicus]